MPGFVRTKKDEALWAKAKKAVKRKAEWSDDQYWATVTTVYKNMGGLQKASIEIRGAGIWVIRSGLNLSQTEQSQKGRK